MSERKAKSQQEDEGVCAAHSGMKTKNSNTTWLLGILITIILTAGGAQIVLLLDLKAEITAFKEGTKLTDYKISDILRDLEAVDRRVAVLEQQRAGK